MKSPYCPGTPCSAERLPLYSLLRITLLKELLVNKIHKKELQPVTLQCLFPSLLAGPSLQKQAR